MPAVDKSTVVIGPLNIQSVVLLNETVSTPNASKLLPKIPQSVSTVIGTNTAATCSGNPPNDDVVVTVSEFAVSDPAATVFPVELETVNLLVLMARSPAIVVFPVNAVTVNLSVLIVRLPANDVFPVAVSTKNLVIGLAAPSVILKNSVLATVLPLSVRPLLNETLSIVRLDPVMFKLPPTYKLPAILAPPLTCNAPCPKALVAVLLVITTAPLEVKPDNVPRLVMFVWLDVCRVPVKFPLNPPVE